MFKLTVKPVNLPDTTKCDMEIVNPDINKHQTTSVAKAEDRKDGQM